MSALLLPAWFVVAALFTYLAYVHWRWAESPLRSFHIRERDEKAEGEGEVEINAEVINDFNSYLNTINEKNAGRHRRAAIWFFVAAVLAVISIFIASPMAG
jgi:hypothetical protein